MQTMVSLFILFSSLNTTKITSDYEIRASYTFIVPDLEEVIDIDNDKIEEKIVGEYECQGTKEKPAACKYYLSVESGGEFAFSRTHIFNDDSQESREYKAKWSRDVIIPKANYSWVYTGDITDDGSTDLIIRFILGMEDRQMIAFDIKNKDIIGCGWHGEFFFLDETEDGRLMLDYLFDDDEEEKYFSDHLLTKDEFSDCHNTYHGGEYWIH